MQGRLSKVSACFWVQRPPGGLTTASTEHRPSWAATGEPLQGLDPQRRAPLQGTLAARFCPHWETPFCCASEEPGVLFPQQETIWEHPFWTQRHFLGTTPTWPWSNPEVTPPLHPLLSICGPSFEASCGGVGSLTASSGTHSICFGRDRDSIPFGLLFPFPSPNQTCQQCFLHF